MVSETVEMVYPACPCCQQEYFSKPKVRADERYTDLCKLCLEEAIEQELCSDDEYEANDFYANKEIVKMLMQEIGTEFNLTESEIQEYAKTLKYILED